MMEVEVEVVTVGNRKMGSSSGGGGGSGGNKDNGSNSNCRGTDNNQQSTITFNVFLINYPGLTKYSIEKDDGVNLASKIGHCEGQT